MKELDLLMQNYLDHRYPSASDSEQQAFKSILQMPDPELYDLVLRRADSEHEEINRVIAELRTILSES